MEYEQSLVLDDTKPAEFYQTVSITEIGPMNDNDFSYNRSYASGFASPSLNELQRNKTLSQTTLAVETKSVSPFRQSLANKDIEFHSRIENAILSASRPFELSETEIIEAGGHKGFWINKEEIQNWSGLISLTDYKINEDKTPEIIHKRTDQTLVYDQEVTVRYLRPPTPPAPGEIIIKQEKSIFTPPAPPLIIRQQPARPETPAPLIVREAPPKAPPSFGRKVITISGKRLPPPPRKVIVERLPPLPNKPQSIVIERWLPFKIQKRKVIFQRNNEPEPVVQKPRNVIIQWEPPQVTIKKEFKDLGIVRANPAEYILKYGATLKSPNELPAFVRDIKPPNGVQLASDQSPMTSYELEGDIDALSLIDLDAFGLSEYKKEVKTQNEYSSIASLSSSSVVTNVLNSKSSSNSSNESYAEGKLTFVQAEKVIQKLNASLVRKINDGQLLAIFQNLDTRKDGLVYIDEFKKALNTEISKNKI